jgi:hypothetical protein
LLRQRLSTVAGRLGKVVPHLAPGVWDARGFSAQLVDAALHGAAISEVPQVSC